MTKRSANEGPDLNKRCHKFRKMVTHMSIRNRFFGMHTSPSGLFWSSPTIDNALALMCHADTDPIRMTRTECTVANSSCPKPARL